eukprot:m.72474 g.72474  ORF g.72474 m.72474 type:complete len:191 (+) comp12336_c1_seq5:2236-2808(+)
MSVVTRVLRLHAPRVALRSGWCATPLATCTPSLAATASRAASLPQPGLLSPPYFFQQRAASTTVTSYELTEHSKSGLFSSVQIRCESWNKPVLDGYMAFITRAADVLDISRNGIAGLPMLRQKFTVLSSPHVYKQHRSQYELRTHKRVVKLKDLTEQTAATFIEYVTKHCPPGISMRVQVKALEKLPEGV